MCQLSLNKYDLKDIFFTFFTATSIVFVGFQSCVLLLVRLLKYLDMKIQSNVLSNERMIVAFQVVFPSQGQRLEFHQHQHLCVSLCVCE